MDVIHLLSTDLQSELKDIKYDIDENAVIVTFIGNKKSNLQNKGELAICYYINSKNIMLALSDGNNFSTFNVTKAINDSINLFNSSCQDQIKTNINEIKSNILNVGIQNYSEIKENVSNKKEEVFDVDFKFTDYGNYGYILKTLDKGKLNWYFIIEQTGDKVK